MSPVSFHPPGLRFRAALLRGIRAWTTSENCLLCGERTGVWIRLCPSCRSGLESAGPGAGCPRCSGPLPCGDCDRFLGPLSGVIAPFRYRGSGGRLVRRGKLSGDYGCLSFLAGAMRRSLRARDLGSGGAPRPRLLVPVPLAGSKRRRRGFNQAEEIARFLGRRGGYGVARSALRRVRATVPQGRLAPEEREENLKGAIRPGWDAWRGACLGREILLVDDVCTSGATLRACARVLLEEAGARKVFGVCACSAKAGDTVSGEIPLQLLE